MDVEYETVICDSCSKEFIIVKNDGYDECYKCYIGKLKNSNTTEKFISKMVYVYNTKTLNFDETKYVNTNTDIIVKCMLHENSKTEKKPASYFIKTLPYPCKDCIYEQQLKNKPITYYIDENNNKTYKIPLSNVDNQFTLVSENVYNYKLKNDKLLCSYSFSLNKDNQVAFSTGVETLTLHRFIVENILKLNNPNNYKSVNHKNKNNLDNRNENLEYISNSDAIASNKNSKLYRFRKKLNLYECSISHDYKSYYAYYKNENHAKHQINLWYDQLGLNRPKLIIENEEEALSDFVLYEKKDKKQDEEVKDEEVLPVNIRIYKGKYKYENAKQIIKDVFDVKYKSKICETLEEAIKFKNSVDDAIKKWKIENEHKQELLYNEELKYYYVKLKNKEVKIDKDDYKNIYCKDKWYITNEYVKNSRIGQLHRLIMKCPDDKEVDHINRDKLDNRKCNLRIVTSSENAQNRTKKPNSSSKFNNVAYINADNRLKKWLCKIVANKTRIYHMYFKEEEDAALAFDIYKYVFNSPKSYNDESRLKKQEIDLIKNEINVEEYKTEKREKHIINKILSDIYHI